MVPYLTAFAGAAGAAALCKEFNNACFQEAKSREVAPMEEEEGEDLCNCEFSLAYGGKILLNNARLHLKRGQRYGLCGEPSCLRGLRPACLRGLLCLAACSAFSACLSAGSLCAASLPACCCLHLGSSGSARACICMRFTQK